MEVIVYLVLKFTIDLVDLKTAGIKQKYPKNSLPKTKPISKVIR